MSGTDTDTDTRRREAGGRVLETRLVTARLVLRAPEAGDAAAIERLIDDIDVSRMLSRVPHPYPAGAAADWIAQIRAAAGTDHAFVILLKDREADGPIGGVGLHPDAASGARELGYWLGRAYWGRGYMTEAAAEAVRFGFEALALPRIVAGHFHDNPASRRVLEKLGFARIGPARRRSLARGNAEIESVEYDLTRAAWEARR